MTPFEWICIIAAICGVLMVLGGIYLFYKGILTLAKAPDQQEAVSFEFQKILKIQSRYPAYGFFIFGIAFVVLGATFAKPDSIAPITVEGSVENAVDPGNTTVRILVTLWEGKALTEDGKIQRVVYPDLSQLRVEITAPGSNPPVVSKRILSNSAERIARFERVRFEKVAEKPSAGEIVALDNKLPPLSESNGFRVAP
jgi:hypothetical protein